MSDNGLKWLDEHTLEFGGVRFLRVLDHRAHDVESTPELFVLMKGENQLRKYLELGSEIRPERVLELGIFKGGSAVFFEIAYRPAKIVAVDLRPPIPALDAYVAQKGLEDRLKAFYRIDQTDRATIGSILDREFERKPLDLVIDDASHLLQQTRTSFNFLFPRLRPGGVYVIEDWGWEHWGGPWQGDKNPLAGTPALTNLIFELTMTVASRQDVVSNVLVMPSMVLARRGSAELDDTFDISKAYAIREKSDFASLFDADDDAALVLARRFRRLERRQPLVAELLRFAGRAARRL